MHEGILIPLIIFSTIFGVSYVYLTTRNKERLALIERGADASLFNSGKNRSMGSIILNLALLAIGIGIGVLVGAGLEQGGLDEEVSYPASIFIFGGLGLVISFFVNRKLEKE
jgi:Na+/H+-dicarboxylate symporter